MAVATVRIRWSDLSLAWHEAVSDLLTAVDDADPIMVEGPVRDAADQLKRVLANVRREEM